MTPTVTVNIKYNLLGREMKLTIHWGTWGVCADTTVMARAKTIEKIVDFILAVFKEVWDGWALNTCR